MRYLPKSPADRDAMLDEIGARSIDDLFATIPGEYRLSGDLKIPRQMGEQEIVEFFRRAAERNAEGFASFLGAGAYRHYRPVVIDALVQRGEFLTSYTPYQAEISQGTLQAIFEFQTMICELTGMEIANASMYDGSTGSAEAVMMAARITGRNHIVVANTVHPEYREVLRTYAQHQGLAKRTVGYAANGRVDANQVEAAITDETACVLIQSPNFFGVVEDVAAIAEIAHAKGALLIVSIAEALSLGIVRPPVEADIVSLEAQSLGVPVGYGGPYCGVLACKEKFIRQMPGRLAGATVDKQGRRGFVLTLSTREQHIRREKATSNICTNQALVALMTCIYLTIYGRAGMRELAEQNLAKAHYAAQTLAATPGSKLLFADAPRFNEFVLSTKESPDAMNARLLERKIIGGLTLSRWYPELPNASLWCVTEQNSREQIDAAAQVLSESIEDQRRFDTDIRVGRGMALEETVPLATDRTGVSSHISQNERLIFEKSSPGKKAYRLAPLDVPQVDARALLGTLAREDLGAMPEVSEIEIIRHFTRLSTWNYAIDLGMYPLGSCTMKYNPRVNEFVARLTGIAEAHPYQPEELSQGAMRVMWMLQDCLKEITGMDAITLQPAAGAHGEFTGILLVRAYHESNGNPRKKILIPDSAHGTNPATAAICGYQVQNLKSNSQGMVDLAELEQLVDEETAALMLTNPSTIGVFESEIHNIAALLHAKGALLYMDGANMNALVGKTRPGDFGADVMHLNLHKTFSTPHGGGGPGSGPVCCKQILEPFLPTPVLVERPYGTLRFDYDRPQSVGRVRMFYGNYGMFVRALAYILANGPDGLRQTTEDAVLNANYIRKKLEDRYELPYKTATLHEVVFSDRRQARNGVKTGDIAKRLIDYGFHPYTTSFPMIVPGALMIEPTESESKEELDRFVDAMRQIAREAEENPEIILNAPHRTRVSRMDEVSAARRPVLRWKPGATAAPEEPAAKEALVPASPAQEY